MALGTPVAGALAYSAASGTSVAPAYPAGILATDVVLLIVGQKPTTANGGTTTTPTGWTIREELNAAGGYGTTIGADVGNSNLRIYSWNTPVAGQTGNLTVTLAANNISWAYILRVPTGGGSILYGSADGQRTTTPTSPMSIALTNGASPTNFQTGDLAVWAMCIPSDVTTPAQFSAQAITATGATFATAVEINEPDSTLGNDIGGYSARAVVTAGTSATAPTVTATLAGTLTNVRGPVALVRIREIAALILDAVPTSYAITGVAATLLENKHLTAEPDTYAITGSDASLARELMVNAEPSAYAVTGFNAALAEDRNLNAESASYAITGAAVTFEIVSSGKELIAEFGTYSVTGFAAQLAFGDVFNAESGSYIVSGSNAALLQGFYLRADPSSYNVSGANATALVTDYLSLDPGTYVTSGSTAALVLEYMFNAETGAYVVTGNPATFIIGIVLNAESVSYSVTGFDAEINKEGSFTAFPGAYDVTGLDAILAKGLILNAEPATKYVDSGYVDDGYVIQTGYYVNGFPATFVYPRYPLPNQVISGVLYGPNGDDYTGTFVCPAGISKQILYIFDE